MKRFRGVLAALAAATAGLLVLTGCSSSNPTPSGDTTSGSASHSNLKIALLTSAAGANDNGYNQTAIDGLKKLQSDQGVSYKVIEPSTDYAGSLKAAAQAGYNLIFSLEYDFDALIKGVNGQEPLAKQFPNTTFVVFNALPNSADGTVNGAPIFKNVISVLFNVNEAAFLAGYLSVEVNENAGTLLDPSKYSFTTGDAGRKLGFIGGTQSDGITVFSYGFAEGANYAAKALGVTYTYYSNFSAGFTDTTLGAQTAGTFFSNGANIVYCEAGTLCNGVDVQAKKVQKLSIEADANLDGNQPGYVLTSVLKNTNVPTYDLGTDLVNGSLAAKGGTVISYTLSSGATGLTDLSTIGKFINTDSAAQAKWAQIQSDLKDVSGKIGDGTIKVTNAQIGETLDMSTLSNIKPA